MEGPTYRLRVNYVQCCSLDFPCVRRIHACAQDCVLFYGEHAQLLRCPNPACRRLRYYTSGAGRLVPVNVMTDKRNVVFFVGWMEETSFSVSQSSSRGWAWHRY